MKNTRTVSGIDWVKASPLNPDFKPNSCPVVLQFAVFLSLIMLVEVAVAIAGYVFRDQVSKGNKGNLSQVALGIWGLKSVLNNTLLYS